MRQICSVGKCYVLGWWERLVRTRYAGRTLREDDEAAQQQLASAALVGRGPTARMAGQLERSKRIVKKWAR
jgi:hypothetical protein